MLLLSRKSKKYNEGEGEQEKEDEDDEPEIYLKQPVEEHTTTMRVVRVDTRTWSKKDSPTFAHQNTIRNVGVDLSTLGNVLRVPLLGRNGQHATASVSRVEHQPSLHNHKMVVQHVLRQKKEVVRPTVFLRGENGMNVIK